jgi:hypothetical protein
MTYDPPNDGRDSSGSSWWQTKSGTVSPSSVYNASFHVRVAHSSSIPPSLLLFLQGSLTDRRLWCRRRCNRTSPPRSLSMDCPFRCLEGSIIIMQVRSSARSLGCRRIGYEGCEKADPFFISFDRLSSRARWRILGELHREGQSRCGLSVSAYAPFPFLSVYGDKS